MLQTTYYEVANRLERIDFPSIWPGFSSGSFALYQEKLACLGGACPCSPSWTGCSLTPHRLPCQLTPWTRRLPYRRPRITPTGRPSTVFWRKTPHTRRDLSASAAMTL